MAAEEERRNIARISGRAGGYTSWANTSDPAARMAATWRGRSARFERQVDPDGTMDPAERARRARQAEAAYMARLSLKAAQARKAKAAAKAKPDTGRAA
ncbi:hypothetical protein AB0I85_28495 [Micromonospora echinofusca]|uniref:hypothetical protein n=1 Tax=Micromonospora echinofusca TaxID=47858 RepID=UPI003406A7E3